jgi:hypothetical protein
MPDEWFVRVHGKEYGPVDLDTLREWKADGRVIAQNEVRRGREGDWILAGAVPELFPAVAEVTEPVPEFFRARTFGQIIGDTLRLYRRGFWVFFAVALISGLPALALQICLLFVDTREGVALTLTSRFASSGAVLSLLTLMVLWPVFIGGIQFATAEAASGRRPRLRDVLGKSLAHWRRIGKLSLFVYGSYLFWTLLPLLAVALVAATPSIPAILLALCALGFQVFMVGRLFINFMFWQQSCTFGALEAADALRDSKELARSRPDHPWHERPLFRGAMLASIWLVVLLVLAVAIEMPFLLLRLRGVASLQDAVTMLQTLTKAPPLDALTFASQFISTIVNAAFRPLIGIAFIVLYFDAKARL